jgi:hypothetical protein
VSPRKPRSFSAPASVPLLLGVPLFVIRPRYEGGFVLEVDGKAHAKVFPAQAAALAEAERLAAQQGGEVRLVDWEGGKVRSWFFGRSGPGLP